MLEHGLAAGGTKILGGNVPCDEAAVRSALAGVEHIALLGGTLEYPAAALGAFSGHFDDYGLSKGAVGEAGAGKEIAEAALLDHHLSAAYLAVFVAEYVWNGDLPALLVFRGLHFLFKVAVEVPQYVAPVCLAALYLVKLRLHAVGELEVDYVGKALGHIPCHDLAEGRGAEVFAFLYNIVVGGDGRDRGRVGGRAANALLLHGADERRLGISAGRLGELLVRQHFFKEHPLALGKLGQGIFYLGGFLFAALLIYGGIAWESQLGVIGAEGVARRAHVHGDVVIDGVRHLGGGEASPDQAIEPVLLLREILAHLLGREVDIGGADSLVGVLRARLGLEAARLAGIIALAIAGDDIVARGVQRLLAQTQGVGTHIGDETHAAVTGYFDALIELLGDGHGALGRHVQAARCLLLQRGGDEGRRGAFLLFAALDGIDGERLVLYGADDLIDFFTAVQLLLFVANAVEARTEGPALGALELGVEQPVFFFYKIVYFLFAVDHHSGGDGLNASGGKAALYLLPEQRGELIAHDTVKDTPCLLCVHKVLIYGTWGFYALGDDALRDLVEGHALRLFVRQLKKLLEVP